ncbi:glycosyltransferase family 4 protein [Rubrivivax sp. RP6-9]|uniref:glycosyltransferase family 4 protein n=1 Tax=Rubrivivax sp. RP6-9 TaxID=3415750 RepID=UPI003CC6D964
MSRLLNVNSYHYRRGGSDVVYLEHAALMERAGWQVGYFSMQHPKNLPTPWSRHFVDELEFGHDYGLLQKLAMAGKVVHSFEAQRRLRGLLAEFPAQVAHLHCIYHHLSPSILGTLQAAGVKVVLTAHDLKIACPAYKMLNAGGICERCRDGSVLNVVRQRCIRGSLGASAIVAVESGVQRWLGSYRRHVDRIVVPSRFFLEKFVQWGWPRERFVHIPNYVDSSAFAPDFTPGDHVLYFGRLAPEKGVATLIDAAARAGVPLRIAGTGPEEAALRALAQRSGGRVEFLGFCAGQALHDAVRSARAVVLPSEWYENAPMSVLESMALGKPVVGADIGGIPELIAAGDTGWLFPSGDAPALADTLRQVMGLPDTTLAAMGRAARAHVTTHYNQPAYLQAMLALYASLGVPLPTATQAPATTP